MSHTYRDSKNQILMAQLKTTGFSHLPSAAPMLTLHEEH